MAPAIAFLSGLEPSAVSCFISWYPKFHQNLARTFRIWLCRRCAGPDFANSSRIHPNNAAKRHSLWSPDSTWLIYIGGVDGEVPFADRGQPAREYGASFVSPGMIPPKSQL